MVKFYTSFYRNMWQKKKTHRENKPPGTKHLLKGFGTSRNMVEHQ